MRSDNRVLFIILGLLLLAVVVLPAVGMGIMGPGMMGPGMMWGYGPWGGAAPANGWRWGLAMALGWLAMLAFWGALIAGGVLLVRWLSGALASQREGGRESALEILKRRYAAGELNREEYERMRQEIER